ncbi:MAG: hypothetical protein Q8L56_05005 [Rhodocyclaceae bacterium]|nr:hypothetical protein [Rhodocyclaceae bacterium]
MNTPTESPKVPQDANPSVAKAGRRRFLGAGSAVAPVILTMFSQPALGVTCFTPSRSLSRNTSVSQAGKNGVCTGAQSPGNYSAQTNDGRPSYSWPIDYRTPFHPTFIAGGSGTSFYKTENNNTRSLTMFEVLNLGGNQDSEKMAFHLIAAYLNCLGGGSSSISPLAMTTTGVLRIWSEWATKGNYEVTAGVYWNATQIKAYLKSNGIVG